MLKRVILSKQCDYDADLFALWTKWYTEVFPSDLIVLTPVLVKGSPVGIDRTLEWYSRQDISLALQIIEMDGWDAMEVWKRQLKILGPFVDSKTLWVSADTDQFFDFSSVVSVNGLMQFRRQELFALSEVSPSSIEETPIYSIENRKEKVVFHRKAGQVGALVGKVEDPRMSATGHIAGTSEAPSSVEYHLTSRGIEQFVTKASTNWNFKTGVGSEHFRRWKKLLDGRGKEGLRRAFEQFFSSHELTEDTVFKGFFIPGVTVPSQEAQDARLWWASRPIKKAAFRSWRPCRAVHNVVQSLPDAHSILEFGCGTGRNLRALRDAGHRVVGLDINEQAIKEGAGRFDLNLLLGGEERLDEVVEKYGPFDLVFTVSVLDHTPDVRRVLAKLLSVARKYFLAIEPYYEGHNGPAKEAITPFSYFWNYPALFDELGAAVLTDNPEIMYLDGFGQYFHVYVVKP